MRPYGPYVKHGKINASLPEGETVETLTLERQSRCWRIKREPKKQLVKKRQRQPKRRPRRPLPQNQRRLKKQLPNQQRLRKQRPHEKHQLKRLKVNQKVITQNENL